MSRVEIEHMNRTTDLTHALKHAEANGSWSVVLCPTTESTAAAARILASLVGDVPFSGRTALLGSGKVSVACADDPVFVPDDEPFYLIYQGWTGTEKFGSGAALWEKKSTGTIKLDGFA